MKVPVSLSWDCVNTLAVCVSVLICAFADEWMDGCNKAHKHISVYLFVGGRLFGATRCVHSNKSRCFRALSKSDSVC